jgi:oryzin
VAAIEEDQIFYLQEISSQSSTPWGLGTISSRDPGSDIYTYDNSAGQGSFAYVVDSGVNIDHVEFEGRASRGYNAVGGVHDDTLGHGTHVAGIAAGRTYGVAKLANIIDVKVFVGRTASTTIIIDGYQWAVNNIIATGRQSRAIINMSLGELDTQSFNCFL